MNFPSQKQLGHFLLSLSASLIAIGAGFWLFAGKFPETLLEVLVFLATAGMLIYKTLPAEPEKVIEPNADGSGQMERPVLSQCCLALRLFAIVAVLTIIAMHVRS